MQAFDAHMDMGTHIHRGICIHIVMYVQKCFVNMYVAMLDFGQEWKGTGLTVLFHTSTSMKANTQECCALCVPHSTQRVSGCGVVATLLPM